MELLYLLSGAGMLENEIQNRESIANSISRPDTDVTVLEVGVGPLSIESAIEEYMAIGPMLQKMREIGNEEYQAIIIGCAGDPGLKPARELLSIPVIGPTESSYHLAYMISDRFSIISILSAGVASGDSTRIQVREMGLETRLASIEFIQVAVADMWGKNRELVTDQIINAAESAKRKRAGCVVLGCMSMAFLLVDEIVEQKTRLPVINPLKVAIKTAETFVDLKLKHSWITYPPANNEKLNKTVFL
ncbi:MAG: aspartate/glutamate racemase family protein [Candidatus Hodarchaeota archaeon]